MNNKTSRFFRDLSACLKQEGWDLLYLIIVRFGKTEIEHDCDGVFRTTRFLAFTVHSSRYDCRICNIPLNIFHHFEESYPLSGWVGYVDRRICKVFNSVKKFFKNIVWMFRLLDCIRPAKFFEDFPHIWNIAKGM
jgi:hypothetical protein